MRLEARATRRPGDKGTKRLLKKYGARLLFVRYRYNPETRKMLTTVELIVDERPAPDRVQPQPPTSTPPAEEVACASQHASVGYGTKSERLEATGIPGARCGSFLPARSSG